MAVPAAGSVAAAPNSMSAAHTARRLFGPNRANTVKKTPMLSRKTVAKARRAVRLLRTLPTPAAHTHTSGTALEHTLREHPGRQHAVWYLRP